MKLPRRVTDVVARLGLTFVHEPDNTLWTGQALNLCYIGLQFYDPSNMVLHELAHYTVAPAHYRVRRNFGWSVAPNGPEAVENHQDHQQGSTKTVAWREEEEQTAQVLTYLAMRALNFTNWEEEAALDFFRRPEEILRQGAAMSRALVEPLTLKPRFLDGYVPRRPERLIVREPSV